MGVLLGKTVCPRGTKGTQGQTFQLTRILRVTPGFCMAHPLTRVE